MHQYVMFTMVVFGFFLVKTNNKFNHTYFAPAILAGVSLRLIKLISKFHFYIK